MRIANLSKEVEMTAVRGGNSQGANQGNGSGALFGNVSLANGGGYSLIGPIDIVTYAPVYDANQINVSADSLTQTINKVGVGLLGAPVLVA